ncbi:MAG: polysaccharide deacetylase family protein [Pseudomonadota bacterium]
MLKSHGRYPYAPILGRADRAWPGGKRLAVYVALNIEHYAFGEGLTEDLVPAGGEPDVLNYAWRDYGNRVGVWRLKALFDELSIPVTLLVNSAAYAHCPEVMAAFRAGGHEIAAHGRTNSERQDVLDEAGERALIAEATATIRWHEGQAPKGWLGPWIAESTWTPDLLKEAGYAYVLDWCCDDQPIRLSTRAGPLLALPYPQEINDSTAIVGRRASAAEFADMIVDQFDEMRDQSAGQPLVFGVALHSYIVGQPFRLRRLRPALRHVRAHADAIWLARAGDIAAFAEGPAR